MMKRSILHELNTEGLVSTGQESLLCFISINHELSFFNFSNIFIYIYIFNKPLCFNKKHFLIYFNNVIKVSYYSSMSSITKMSIYRQFINPT